MLDPSRSDLLAAVAGSGTMGRGIVQALAQCGLRVRVYDAQAGAAARAKDAIAKALAGVVAKGRPARAGDGTQEKPPEQPVPMIRDSAGFVAQRVVAHIVNVGCGSPSPWLARRARLGVSLLTPE